MSRPCGEAHPLPCGLDEDCPVPVSYFDPSKKSETIVRDYEKDQ